MRIRFDPFVLNLDTRQLLRQTAEVRVTPKAFELLTVLVQERPKALSKAQLLTRLWPKTYVAEANLSNLIAEIRAALDDSARQPRWVRTAHGFGYAFCGDAVTVPDERPAGRERPACWLQWGGRRFPLAPGEHLIGRDPDVAIRLDASTVSRRHARLIVSADETVLEDFGSKNGTRCGGDRVTSPVRLADGDAIYFGSLLVTFHMRPRVTTTDTQTAVFR